MAVAPAVGLVGAGRMGSAMARALHRAGRPLVVWNRDRSRAEALVAELAGDGGARASVAVSPAAAVESGPATILMLADDAAVADVFERPDGILAAAAPGAVVADCSTTTPGLLERWAGAAARRGIGLLDAPVSGSTTSAEAGQLVLMVGGAAASLEGARPALEGISRTIHHLGPLGAGGAMKLAVNTLIFGLNQAVAEGLVLAEAAGIDRAAAYEVLATSAAGAPFVGYKRAAFTSPADTPVAFALELAEKDLRLITAHAGRLGVPVPQAEVNLASIRAAAASLGPGRDFAAVAESLRAAVAVAVAPEQEEGDPR